MPDTPAGTGPATQQQQVTANFNDVADRYDDSEAFFSGPIADQLVAAAALAAGDRVLDAGCGTGAATARAAAAVGPTGQVTGIDLSGQMLRAAAARLSRLPQAQLICADAENPPFPAASFDVILASLVLYLLPHPARAVRRYLTLLRPGGRLAFSWNASEDPAWRPVYQAVETHIPPGIQPLSELLYRWPFTAPEAMDKMLAQAGYAAITTQIQPLPIHYTGPAQWWEAGWSRARRLAWQHIPAGQRDAVRDKALTLLQPLREPDGSLTRTPHIAWTVAHRPGSGEAAPA